ncbi:DUF748 domain-containing protein [Propionivibrio dicarboxylicus]|uniref:DUF748 domain-containing protein n=1 Tax=Propionivibrio dicarboxylicus TaxID=83767 RepID=A0A1G8CTV0_9RHOO|nr:protein of unknown function [Propionivibrio dicarboxylicus]
MAYAGLAIVLFAILGFFVLPPIVKSVLIDQASKALHRTVAVKRVDINPFAMTLDVDGLSIKERDSETTFLAFDKLHINLDAASLFKGGVVIGELRLDGPRVHVARLSAGQYNFSDLLEAPQVSPAPKSEAKPPMFSVSNIRITGGSLAFDDQPMREKHEIQGVNVSLPFISNMAFAVDTFVEPSFSAVVNGAPVHAKVKSKPFSESHESELAMDLADLKLTQYLPYVPAKLPVKVQSGMLDVGVTLRFHQDKGGNASIHLAGKSALRNIDVRDSQGAALLAFKRLELVLGALDLPARKVQLDRVLLESPDVSVTIDQKGRLNLTALSETETSGAGAKAPAAGDDSAKAQPESPFDWSLGEFSLNGGLLRVVDQSRKMPFKGSVDIPEIRVKKLSGRGLEPAEIAARVLVNRRGELGVTGSFNPVQGAADLNVTIKSLELLPFQPYFAEKLNVAVTRGQLTADGALHLRKATDSPIGVVGQFSGQATLGDFQAVDKPNSADFLRWKSFYFGKVDLNLQPMSVSVGEIALSDFFARVIVSREGKLNLLQLVRQDENAPVAAPAEPLAASGEGKATTPLAPKEAASKPVMPVRIGKITLQGGDVRFTDNFVKPNYTANLRKISGRISGLSSEPGTTAKLELRGRYDDVAPLTVDAQINPLSAKPYLDLQAEIKGVEMTPFSSYSGKYAGYAIEKGKLSLFVKYKIENDQLEAENRVFIDQLTFGDAVDSPEATKLPVRLAVSLLKNRSGEIDLNLPISGSLNDPQFSVGGLVVKVIVNLVVKAVASPFALLGSMFGGEELSAIEFDAGRETITPTAEKRLENLAKALIDRPELKLEIASVVDPVRELEALKRVDLERKVKAAKREDLTRSGVASGAVDSIQIRAEEYPALLERAYRAEKFPKPRNVVGLVKTLPVEEMEKLMLTYANVGDETLRELGETRARQVRDWLAAHQVSLERIFMLPGKLTEAGDAAGGEKKAAAGQVVFSLK